MAGSDAQTTSALPKGSTAFRVPGAYGKRKATAGVVAHGHMSNDVCETVFRTALVEWGLSGTTEEQRDTLLWCFAEVFVHGTSAETSWDEVTFNYEGTTFPMSVFNSVVSRFTNHVNPIRVWSRDFRRAEIPMRIHELLNDPDNLDIRQMAIASYGTTIDNARFCFDTAGALLHSGMVVSQADIILITTLSVTVIARAQNDAQSRGQLQATSNHAGTVGGQKPVASAAAVETAPPAARAGFKSLR